MENEGRSLGTGCGLFACGAPSLARSLFSKNSTRGLMVRSNAADESSGKVPLYALTALRGGVADFIVPAGGKRDGSMKPNGGLHIVKTNPIR
jgi:hypothetical protein